MGLEFKSELERNPVNQAPAQPPVDPCFEMREEFDLMNQFIEGDGLAIRYDLWKAAKAEAESSIQSTLKIDEDIDFEEVE